MATYHVFRRLEQSPPIQPTQLIAGLGLVWLGACLVLDWVMMPLCYGSGMMQSPGFASFGYPFFQLFNRLELLAVAGLVSAVLWQRLGLEGPEASDRPGLLRLRDVQLSLVLMAVVLVCTYGLTPAMGAILAEVSYRLPGSSDHLPGSMNILHGGYWLLEAVKYGAIAGLVKLNWQD
jgi:hypothetical protein